MHALAVAMAEVLFPAPGRGRKKGRIWDDKRYRQLGSAYFNMQRDHPRLSDVKIATIISKDDPDFKEYRSDPELLRQRLAKAKREYNSWAEDQAADYFNENDREDDDRDE